MALEILSVDRHAGKEIIIGFSDGSIATYTAEELAATRQFRRVPKEYKERPSNDLLSRE